MVIFATQLNDLLGLGLASMPAGFIGKLACCVENAGKINPATVGVSAFTVIAICLVKRFLPRWPAMLIGMLAATVLTALCGFQVETIGSRFGELPRTLPMPAFVFPGWHELPELVMPAFTIALLAGIESLLSATVADGMTGGRHRPNTELTAQGIGNIGSVLFGGIPRSRAPRPTSKAAGALRSPESFTRWCSR